MLEGRKLDIRKPKVTPAYMHLLTDFSLELMQSAVTCLGITDKGVKKFETTETVVLITLLDDQQMAIPYEALEIIFRYTLIHRKKYFDQLIKRRQDAKTGEVQSTQPGIETFGPDDNDNDSRRSDDGVQPPISPQDNEVIYK